MAYAIKGFGKVDEYTMGLEAVVHILVQFVSKFNELCFA